MKELDKYNSNFLPLFSSFLPFNSRLNQTMIHRMGVEVVGTLFVIFVVYAMLWWWWYESMFEYVSFETAMSLSWIIIICPLIALTLLVHPQLESDGVIPCRSFLEIENDKLELDKNFLRVMQFNTLAETNATQESFPFVNKKYLAWSHRFPMIISEITDTMPDVVCLQEVYNMNEFNNKLKEYGYAGVHAMKEHGREGPAIFYLKDKFLNYEEDVKVHVLKLDEKTFGIFLALKLKFPLPGVDQTVNIVCAHLKAKEEFENYRKLQAEELHCFMTRFYQCNTPSQIKGTLIIAADANCEIDSPANIILRKDLHSAYTDVFNNETGKEKDKFVTTSKNRTESGLVKREIDFIFYDPRHLAISGVQQMPEGILSSLTNGLPSQNYPSDHVALCAEFRFI